MTNKSVSETPNLQVGGYTTWQICQSGYHKIDMYFRIATKTPLETPMATFTPSSSRVMCQKLYVCPYLTAHCSLEGRTPSKCIISNDKISIIRFSMKWSLEANLRLSRVNSYSVNIKWQFLTILFHNTAFCPGSTFVYLGNTCRDLAISSRILRDEK